MKLPNSREREVMQRLRGAGWVKATGLPDAPRIISNLIQKGWVESEQTEGGPMYRLTEPGLQAMKAPIPMPGRKP
jgi:chromosome segregation and condensation protein ScpB